MDFGYYLSKYREELNDPEIIIYGCAECGDYDCGGITVNIDRTEISVIWLIKDENKDLKFEFEKNLYFSAFDKFLDRNL